MGKERPMIEPRLVGGGCIGLSLYVDKNHQLFLSFDYYFLLQIIIQLMYDVYKMLYFKANFGRFWGLKKLNIQYYIKQSSFTSDITRSGCHLHQMIAAVRLIFKNKSCYNHVCNRHFTADFT